MRADDWLIEASHSAHGISTTLRTNAWAIVKMANHQPAQSRSAPCTLPVLVDGHLPRTCTTSAVQHAILTRLGNPPRPWGAVMPSILVLILSLISPIASASSCEVDVNDRVYGVFGTGSSAAVYGGYVASVGDRNAKVNWENCTICSRYSRPV